jgi:hypothetical protein
MALSVKELKRRGVSDQDIRTAHIVQDAQRRTGSPVQSLGQIIAGRPLVASEPADLTQRQLRKRGRYGAAALLTDQEALTESDSDRALKARHASAILKELAAKPQQLEFDFFKGNRMIADEFHDAVRDRLNGQPLSVSRRATAIMVLAEICRHLPWESHVCPKTAADLADILKMHRGELSESLALLEQIGAILRVKRGRTKVITVTPEGAFRGRVDQHAAAVDSYRKTLAEAGNVVPLRPTP